MTPELLGGLLLIQLKGCRMKNSDPIYFKTLMYFMIIATVALAVAIAIAKLPPTEQPEGTFHWSRIENQINETNAIEKLGNEGQLVTEVFYNNLDKPFYRAMFEAESDNAFQLGVDMDQDGVIDFTIIDMDGDGNLDFNVIFCHENCEEVTRRALALFNGTLTLEKTI